MMLPDIVPSRSESQRRMLEALTSDSTRLYVDASVLIHCYEMSRSASEELLAALEAFGARVRVPVWSAKETWDHTRGLRSRRPLGKLSGALTSQLARFRSESLRYVDERSFEDLSVEQFINEMDAFVSAGDTLARRTERLEPGHDDANARLLPFIADHSIPSEMVAIYEEVQRTGEQRYAHEVPPGFKDGGTKTPQPGEDDDVEQPKGKKRNRFGDLIMWLEALQDCTREGCAQLVVLTRDNTKGDWVYNPERVRDDDGRLQQNGGVLTLPLPLLVQEALTRCPTLTDVHVISLEMFTQLVRSGLGARVSNLVRALQSGGAPRRPPRPADRPQRPPLGQGAVAEVSFGSGDMMFEPVDAGASPIWRQVSGLRAEGWTAQNEAAAALAPLMPQATPDEAKQVGRAVVVATGEGALGPLELVQQLLGDATISAEVRANLLVGMLGEIYFDEQGEPTKPVAHPEVVGVVYDHAADPETRRAYEVTVGAPLEPLRRLYLALPGEARKMRVEVQLAGSVLRGLQVEGRELLELDAPVSRQIVPGGRGASMSVTELLKAVAAEFIVPPSDLEVDGPTSFELELPERIGFIEWGPEVGEQLR